MSPSPSRPPVPPEKPLPSDCCDSGCAVCVNDAYAEALACYEAQLAAWRAQHPEADASAGDAPHDPPATGRLRALD